MQIELNIYNSNGNFSVIIERNKNLHPKSNNIVWLPTNLIFRKNVKNDLDNYAKRKL